LILLSGKAKGCIAGGLLLGMALAIKGWFFCALRNSSFFVNDGNYAINTRSGLIVLGLQLELSGSILAAKFRMRIN